MRTLNLDDSDIQIVAEFAAGSCRWLKLGKYSFHSPSIVCPFQHLSKNDPKSFSQRWIKWVPPFLLACCSCHRRCLDLTRERCGIFLSQCGHLLCSACKPEYDWRQVRQYRDCPKCQEKIVILTEFSRDWGKKHKRTETAWHKLTFYPDQYNTKEKIILSLLSCYPGYI